MENLNVLFLDIDGVVNTPMWVEVNGKLRSRYNFPENGKVNNWQACQWVSEFCRQHNYSIVVSSTWRTAGLKICKECLYLGGIDKTIPIIGSTPVLHIERGHEIQQWLDGQAKNGVKIKRYLIVDDDKDAAISAEQLSRFIECRGDVGFNLYDFKKAEELNKAMKRGWI